MPREIVAASSQHVVYSPEMTPEMLPSKPYHSRTLSLAFGWHKDGNWVQAYMIPEGWQSTGDWSIVDLGIDEIDHAIRVLKRAKRQAYPSQRRSIED